MINIEQYRGLLIQAQAENSSWESRKTVDQDLRRDCDDGLPLPTLLDLDAEQFNHFLELMLIWDQCLIDWTKQEDEWNEYIEHPFGYVLKALFHDRSPATDEQKASFLLRAGKQLLSVPALSKQAIYYFAYARAFPTTSCWAKADGLFQLEKYLLLFSESYIYFNETYYKNRTAKGYEYLLFLLKNLLQVAEALRHSDELGFFSMRLEQNMEFNALFSQLFEPGKKEDAANYLIFFFPNHAKEVARQTFDEWRACLDQLGTYDATRLGEPHYYFALIANALISGLRSSTKQISVGNYYKDQISTLESNNRAIRNGSPNELPSFDYLRTSMMPSFPLISDEPSDIADWHAQHTNQIQHIFKQCAQVAIDFIGMAPCDYVILAGGSFGLGHCHERSDLDISILIRDNKYQQHAYWQQWLGIMQNLLLEFNGRWKANAYDSKKYYLPKEIIGLGFDRGNLDNVSQAGFSLIQSSDELTQLALTVDADPTNGKPIYRYELRHSQLLYVNHPAAEELWHAYQALLFHGLQQAEKKQAILKTQLEKIRSDMSIRGITTLNNSEDIDFILTELKTYYIEPIEHYIVLQYDTLMGGVLEGDYTSDVSLRIPAILKQLKAHTPHDLEWIIALEKHWQILRYQQAYLLQNNAEKNNFKEQRADCIQKILKPFKIHLAVNELLFSAISRFSTTPNLDLLALWQNAWTEGDKKLDGQEDSLIFLRTGIVFIHLYSQFLGEKQKIIAKKPQDIMRQAEAYRFIDHTLAKKWLDFISDLESDMPVDRMQQRLPLIRCFCRLLLKGLNQVIEKKQWTFHLTDIYYQQLRTELKYAEDPAVAFIEVTGQLLALQAPISQHRYHYGLLPAQHRARCLAAAQAHYTSYAANDLIIEDSVWEAPLADGTRECHEQAKIEWLIQLQERYLSSRSEAGRLSVRIKSLELLRGGQYWLKTDIIEHLIREGWLSENGAFVKKQEHPIAKNMPGNHLVIPYPNAQNPTLYLKVFPEYPILELWRNDWQRRLGRTRPREIDLWLWSCGDKKYPILVSEAVPGITLTEWFRQNPEKEPFFEEKSFGETILLNALLRFDDGKPDNSIITYNAQQQAQLWLVDSDRYLVGSFDQQQKVKVNDIAFCFKDAMDGVLADEVREEFLSLHIPQTLESSLDQLITLGDRCQEVFGSLVTTFYQEGRPENERSQLIALLPPGIIYYLLENLQILQVLLAKRGKVKLWDILAQVDNRLANHYRYHTNKAVSPSECFKAVAKESYRNSEKWTAQWFWTKSTTTAEAYLTPLNFKTFVQDLWHRTVSSATLLQTWKADRAQIVQEITRLKFDEGQLKIAKENLLQGDLENFKKLNIYAQELILDDLDWSRPNLANVNAESIQKWQRTLIEYLKKNSEQLQCYQSLSFRHCAALTDNDIGTLIRCNRNQLRSLRLVDCPNVGGELMNIWQISLPRLKNLELERLPRIGYLGYLSGSASGKMQLLAEDLGKLHIKDCPQLQQINIKASLLKELNITQCPSLKIIRTASERLTKCILQVDALSVSERAQVCTSTLYLSHFSGLVSDPLDTLIQFCPVLLALDWENISKSRLKALQKIFSQEPLKYSDPNLTARVKILEYAKQWLFNRAQNMTVLEATLSVLKNKNNNDSIREAAILTLGRADHTNELVITTLLLVLQDRENARSLRRAAILVLGQLDCVSEAVITALLFVVKDKKNDGELRQSAVVVLGELNCASKVVMTTLLFVLQDKDDPVVRKAIVSVLWHLDKTGRFIIDTFLRILNDNKNHPKVRKAIVVALCQLGLISEPIINTLLLVLEDKANVSDIRENTLLLVWEDKVNVSDIREAAAFTLGQLGEASESVISALLRVLSDKNNQPKVAGAAITALERLGQISQSMKNTLSLIIKHNHWYVSNGGTRPLDERSLFVEQALDTGPIIDICLLALEDQDLSIREAAAIALGHLGESSERLINALLRTLTDASLNKVTKWFASVLDNRAKLRQAIVTTLGQLGQANEQVIDALLRALQDNDVSVRVAAAIALSQLGQVNEQVLDILLFAINNPDNVSVTRKTLITALGQLGDTSEPVMTALLSALQEDDLSVRIAAAIALSQQGQSSELVLDTLLQVLEDENSDPAARKIAVKILGQSGKASERVINALLLVLKNKNNNLALNETVMTALGQLGQASNAVINTLLVSIKNNGWHVETLDQTSKKVITGLLSALKIKGSALNIREKATSILREKPWLLEERRNSGDSFMQTEPDADGWIGSYRLPQAQTHTKPRPMVVVPVLQKRSTDGWLAALEDEDLSVREIAATALGQLDKANVSEVVIRALLRAFRENNLQGVASLFSVIIDTIGLSAKAKVRRAIVTALGQLGQSNPQITDVLLLGLKDYNELVCEAAAIALGQLGKPSEPVISALLNIALKSTTLELRIAAIIALGQLGKGNELVVSMLLGAVKSDKLFIREAGAKALGQLGDTRVQIIDALLLLMMSKDYDEVRNAALTSLAQLREVNLVTLFHLLLVMERENGTACLTILAALLGDLNQTSALLIDALLIVVQAKGSSNELSQARELISNALLSTMKKSRPAVCTAATEALGQLNEFLFNKLLYQLTALPVSNNSGVTSELVLHGDYRASLRSPAQASVDDAPSPIPQEGRGQDGAIHRLSTAY